MLSNKTQSALYDIRHNILAARRFVETIVWETTHNGLGPLLSVVVAEIEALDPKS